jgi:CIC family chloride channel protein
MTSVLMIFEMTQDYAVIVPLMIANMVSLFVAGRLQHEPIYEALAGQDGIHLPSVDRVRSDQFQVASVMLPANHLLAARLSVKDALQQIGASEARTWLVTDSTGISGVVNVATLHREVARQPDRKLADLAGAASMVFVHRDQPLDLALERMGKNQMDILPVVNRGNLRKLEGMVTMRDILDAYGITPS